ncbi:hypothetical protein CALCODRAFT_179524 [Calocera cornea HHB12733]|uniref:Uncharacterized protein n=1 Tax=Calocera cornea HHB12733 TaxID=1353952 RepID=A0A165CCI7_9BASI|nr:hypothetical protein CALCODRAFT_201637 [Calocera cornea HHB12733]KZT50581.1 hypothetical protein CALCODRAFT_179524 [Calocera cornea HHB12733]
MCSQQYEHVVRNSQQHSLAVGVYRDSPGHPSIVCRLHHSFSRCLHTYPCVYLPHSA